MAGAHTEICLAEYQYRQQHNHSRYTVVCTEYFTKKRDKHHTKRHDQIHFKIVDQNMSAFFFPVGCIFDKLFGTDGA